MLTRHNLPIVPIVLLIVRHGWGLIRKTRTGIPDGEHDHDIHDSQTR